MTDCRKCSKSKVKGGQRYCNVYHGPALIQASGNCPEYSAYPEYVEIRYHGRSIRVSKESIYNMIADCPAHISSCIGCPCNKGGYDDCERRAIIAMMTKGE